MATATMHSVRVARTIKATPEKLFQAWTDPARLKGWWHMDADGSHFVEALTDLKVGGRYRLGMTTPDGVVHTAIGVYREITRPTKLVFTWDWEDPGSRVGETVVTIEFKDAGAGQTEVVLTHNRFADPNRAAQHEQGWNQLLKVLEQTSA